MVNCSNILRVKHLPPILERKWNTIYLVETSNTTCDAFVIGNSSNECRKIIGNNNGSGDFVFSEIPNGIVNGINSVFTIGFNTYIPETLQVFVNGVLQKITQDYTVSGINIMFNFSPQTGETLLINYKLQ